MSSDLLVLRTSVQHRHNTCLAHFSCSVSSALQYVWTRYVRFPVTAQVRYPIRRLTTDDHSRSQREKYRTKLQIISIARFLKQTGKVNGDGD